MCNPKPYTLNSNPESLQVFPGDGQGVPQVMSYSAGGSDGGAQVCYHCRRPSSSEFPCSVAAPQQRVPYRPVDGQSTWGN